MRSILAALFCIMTGLGCVGCSTIKRTFNGDIYRVDAPWWDSRTDKLDKEDMDEIQLDLAVYCFPDRSEATPKPANPPQCKDNVTAYQAAVYSASARDALQDKLIELSNRECSKHKAAIFGTNTGSNLLLSTLASLLTGGATGFAAQSTKTALAAGSSFVIATQSHFNEQVYRQLFVGTIVKAIDDDRTARLAEIYDHRRYPVPYAAFDPRVSGGVVGEDVAKVTDPNIRTPPKEKTTGNQVVTPANATESSTVAIAKAPTASAPRRLAYSIEEAIVDVRDYHDRCSLYNGLVRVAATVQAFSPCEILEARRDRILVELGAIRAAREEAGNLRDRFASFTTELKTVETKLQTCGQAATVANK